MRNEVPCRRCKRDKAEHGPLSRIRQGAFQVKAGAHVSLANCLGYKKPKSKTAPVRVDEPDTELKN